MKAREEGKNVFIDNVEVPLLPKGRRRQKGEESKREHVEFARETVRLLRELESDGGLPLKINNELLRYTFGFQYWVLKELGLIKSKNQNQ